MQKVLSVLLLVGIVVGAGYWYDVTFSACDVPISYRIGVLDDRFGLSREEALDAISDAEALWEREAGAGLFIYDPEQGELLVNFLYDDRQEETDEEQALGAILDRKETLTNDIREDYEALAVEYETLKRSYEAEVARYEARLQSYNNEVAEWNDRGGAPQDVYEELNAEKRALDAESRRLSERTEELNDLVSEINAIGEESNVAIRDYNENVRLYNSRFNHHREFTQGDYRGNAINIYQFEDALELRTVLAHEFGHALGLEHVVNEQSVMYFLMEGQHLDLALTTPDLEEFRRVCAD